jgi:hypothetical protein
MERLKEMEFTVIPQKMINPGKLPALIEGYRKLHHGEDFILLNQGDMLYLHEGFEIFAALSFEYRKSCIFIENIWVEYNLRHTGYGTVLMKHFFETIRNEKKDVELHCLKSNLEAREFFRKLHLKQKYVSPHEDELIIKFEDIEKYFLH